MTIQLPEPTEIKATPFTLTVIEVTETRRVERDQAYQKYLAPPVGEVMNIKLIYHFAARDGSFDLWMNDVPCWSGFGRTGHKASGFGIVALTAYGNILDADVVMRFGTFEASA